MYIQEVFSAIYASHLYEYFVIDREWKVVAYSDNVWQFCSQGIGLEESRSIFEFVPELYGMEGTLNRLLEGEESELLLPYIFKEPEYYVNIRIHSGNTGGETVIILFENVTEMAKTQQSLVQERNEKALLLKELSEKNVQLKRYNDQMQELVKEEMRKNLEKQKMVELQSRYSQMGEMISMITHQWKQPLSAISMIAHVLKLKHQEIMKKGTLTEKFDAILRQTEYMNQTVNDFQEFFKPSKNRVRFNLYQTVSTVLELVKDEYMLKRISLELKGEEEIIAYGYPNEFNQVVLTLLKNAKDAFGENPKENMRIEILIREEGENAVVDVRDNAGGIDENIMAEIFDLYVTSKTEGSGLGLNIAKNMIEANMQGELTARNVEGGAQFSIVLKQVP